MAYGQILGQSFEQSPVLDNYFTKDETLTDSTATSFGLRASSATPNSVFSKLKDALLLSGTSGTPKKPNGSSVTISASGISGIAGAVFETGTYTGNGASSRKISLGFQPSAVLLENWAGERRNGQYTCGGLSVSGAPLVAPAATGNAVMEITSSGFQINSANDGRIGEKLNLSGVLYRYIVFR